METIPSPVYIGILFLVWAFASVRGGPFPLRIVSLYLAFFILCTITSYLVQAEIIPFSAHVIAQCLLLCALYDDAKEGRSIKAVNKLCYALFAFMALVIYSYALHLNYDALHYQTQNILLNVHNLGSVIIELYILKVFVEMIDGAGGDPIYTRFLATMLYVFSLFAPHRESFHYQENQGLENADKD